MRYKCFQSLEKVALEISDCKDKSGDQAGEGHMVSRLTRGGVFGALGQGALEAGNSTAVVHRRPSPWRPWIAGVIVSHCLRFSPFLNLPKPHYFVRSLSVA
jgi:hypothetical protein